MARSAELLQRLYGGRQFFEITNTCPQRLIDMIACADRRRDGE